LDTQIEQDKTKVEKLKQMVNAIRALSMDAVQNANSGHPASPMGWHRWFGRRSSFIGMSGFGASAPAEDLYQHFGITAEAIQDEVRRFLQI